MRNIISLQEHLFHIHISQTSFHVHSMHSWYLSVGRVYNGSSACFHSSHITIPNLQLELSGKVFGFIDADNTDLSRHHKSSRRGTAQLFIHTILQTDKMTHSLKMDGEATNLFNDFLLHGVRGAMKGFLLLQEQQFRGRFLLEGYFCVFVLVTQIKSTP